MKKHYILTFFIFVLSLCCFATARAEDSIEVGDQGTSCCDMTSLVDGKISQYCCPYVKKGATLPIDYDGENVRTKKAQQDCGVIQGACCILADGANKWKQVYACGPNFHLDDASLKQNGKMDPACCLAMDGEVVANKYCCEKDSPKDAVTGLATKECCEERGKGYKWMKDSLLNKYVCCASEGERYVFSPELESGDPSWAFDAAACKPKSGGTSSGGTSSGGDPSSPDSYIK